MATWIDFAGAEVESGLDGKDYLIILGAPKCATTSVAFWLGALPDTAIARRRETLFFTDYPDRRWQGPGAGFVDGAARDDTAFRACFAHAPDAGLRVESSTDNLSCAVTCDRIAAFRARDDVRSVKVLAITRDPVERIVSEFEHTLRLGWQSADLMASLRAERQRTEDGWHPLFQHVRRSSYASQLAPFKEAFGDDLLILDYHRIKTPETLERLTAFAGRAGADTAAGLKQFNARRVYARPRTEQAIQNPRARAIARALVPKGLRDGVRSILRGKPRQRHEARAEERAFILDALRDEIAACVADPAIPTGNWPSLEA
jgi:hypothetical protein